MEGHLLGKLIVMHLVLQSRVIAALTKYPLFIVLQNELLGSVSAR